MKPKILVIDDNAFEAKQLKGMLEELGHDVHWADSGAQGMKMIKELLPDLILLDLTLHHVSAAEVCRWAKLNPETKHLPILMLTTRTELKERIACMEEGAIDYILKPFDRLELKARIDSVYREKHLVEELRKKDKEQADLLLRLQTIAATDPITSLFSRERFQAVIAQEFERSVRYNTPLSCFILGVDHLDEINESCGREVGDEVIRMISQTIQGQIRGVDTVARYGGDEFALLLTQQKRKEAEKIAKRIVDRIRQHPIEALSKRGKKVTISIGVSSIPDSEIRRVEQMLQCAEEALKKAQKEGDTVQSVSPKEIEENGRPKKKEGPILKVQR
ncbi:MAG: diguanylate cyclase [Candidatus Manganitrophaceae bacterium]